MAAAHLEIKSSVTDPIFRAHLRQGRTNTRSENKAPSGGIFVNWLAKRELKKNGAKEEKLAEPGHHLPGAH